MFNQLTTFFIYVIAGMAICIFYDIFRVLRKSIKTSNIVTYIEDVIFWVIVCAFLIWLIFKVNFGELRSYIFIGLILGGIIYLLTFSKYFITINVRILTALKKIIIKIFTPIINIIKKPIIFVYINIKKIYKKTLEYNSHKVRNNNKLKTTNHLSFYKIFKLNNSKRNRE